MTGRRATLNDSTVFSIEWALLITSFVYLFMFIKGNAVSVINLNYSTCIKRFTWKIVKKQLFWKEKLLFETKTFFLQKNTLKKNFFLENFFLENFLSLLVPISPGEK